MTWVQIEPARGRAYRVWIHTWHPAFWIAAYGMFRASGNGRLASIYWAARLILVMAKRKR
jgi:hypothetical protein